jgi:hypothetical protein
MSYPINKSNGDLLVTLEDGQLNSDTSVGLVGRNYVGYGEIQNENFLHLLENFASSGPPAKAIPGQLWFNLNQKILNVYDGDTKSWNPVGSASISQSDPLTPINGQLWFDSKSNQLKVYTGSSWIVVGPESVNGFGVTKARSTTLIDTQGTARPVIELVINDTVVAIIASNTFIIKSTNPVSGFDSIVPGINMASGIEISGTLNGTADYANRLTRASKINGIGFDGAADINIPANTSHLLKKGNYLLGSDFNGSADVTLSVNAEVSNVPSTVVARDAAGNFAANEITATLKGQVNAPNGISTFDTIKVNSIIGTAINGIADSASRLNPGGMINGVLFTGEVSDITVAAAANTLTGTKVADNVVDSKLRTVGILKSLTVSDTGELNNAVTITAQANSIPTVSSTSGKLTISAGTTGAALTFYNTTTASSLGLDKAAILPSGNNDTYLGSAANKFNTVYATTFNGIALQAYYADLAENYVADALYTPGTVVQFGGEYEVTIGTSKTSKVAGVVSTNPAYLMNSHQEGEFIAAVALQGKVPCKVAGLISKGDMLISGGHGYAIASDNPKIGTVIGKALEDFHGEYGVINIVVGRV